MSDRRAVTVKLTGDVKAVEKTVKAISKVLNIVFEGDLKQNTVGQGGHIFLTVLLEEVV